MRPPLPRGCALALLAAAAFALSASGCGTSHPKPVALASLAEAQTFPYYRAYWAGPVFEGFHLSATDGVRGYNASVGTSVYYGDCVHYKGIFGGGSCLLPLQVTTVIYRLHSNSTLGPQRNLVVRGVPAVVYDEGRSIEVYTGRVAVDVFGDDYAHAIAAARLLRPINAPGSATGALPAPIYCPGLSGAQDAGVRRVMESLPRHACQRARAELAYAERVYEQR